MIIREFRDHCLFDSFPGHIAAFHARHRLLVPRHPPYALSSLITVIPAPSVFRNCFRQPLSQSRSTVAFDFRNQAHNESRSTEITTTLTRANFLRVFSLTHSTALLAGYCYPAHRTSRLHLEMPLVSTTELSKNKAANAHAEMLDFREPLRHPAPDGLKRGQGRLVENESLGPASNHHVKLTAAMCQASSGANVPPLGARDRVRQTCERDIVGRLILAVKQLSSLFELCGKTPLGRARRARQDPLLSKRFRHPNVTDL